MSLTMLMYKIAYTGKNLQLKKAGSGLGFWSIASEEKAQKAQRMIQKSYNSAEDTVKIQSVLRIRIGFNAVPDAYPDPGGFFD